MTLGDFVDRVKNVQYAKAKSILNANLNPTEVNLELANKDGEKLQSEQKGKSFEDSEWWSIIQIRYHKTVV